MEGEGRKEGYGKMWELDGWYTLLISILCFVSDMQSLFFCVSQFERRLDSTEKQLYEQEQVYVNIYLHVLTL